MTDTAKVQRDARLPEQRQRRRNDSEAVNAGTKLLIPDWVYDKFPKAEFRHAWIIDDAARLQQKYKEDWDVVENVEHIPGAQDKFGKPVNHILHVKRLAYVQEDRAKAEKRRKLVEEQAVRGVVAGKGNDAGEGLSSDVSYADASNRLR